MTNQLRLATLAVCLAAAQAATGQQFEVASIKPASPGQKYYFPGHTGGPGTADPTRARFSNYSIWLLINRAYDVPFPEMSGPDWLKVVDSQEESGKFDIEVAVPPTTTGEQFRAMLQNLLAERFGLACHREKNPGQIYELVVGRGGHKLKESEKPMRPSLKLDGSGVANATFEGYTIKMLAGWLRTWLDRPVVDRTGLEGRYDFSLHFAFVMLPQPDSEGEAEPGIVDAVGPQLGLKLVSARGDIETLVVDHVNRTPSSN